MTGKGIIVKTNGATATARISKSSACGHDCGECRLCNNPQIEVEILNPINAAVGDTVLIGTSTSKVLRDTFLLYMLPVIGAIIFYAAGSALFHSVIYASALVAIYLTLWFIAMKHYSKNKVAMSSALEVVYEKN